MYNDTGYGGVPDELPSNYGYADSAPSTVHANAPTAKDLFEPVANYPMSASTNGRGSVGPVSQPSQRNPYAQYGAPRSAQRPLAQQSGPVPGRMRAVGPPPFRASGRHTTPSDVVSMRARPTEQTVQPGVPKAIRYEDLPENLDGDDDALGYDYGATAEEKAAKKKAKEDKKAAARDAKYQKKSMASMAKTIDKNKTRDWKQAAQLGLRFDQPRGKWYREVRISGVADIKEENETSSDRPSLTQGSKGAAVKRAQKLLAQKGFPTGSDGIFSANMKKQVIAFQNATSLEGDGKIGKETWEALDPTGQTSDKPSSEGQTIRQYQDGAVAIMKGAVPSGAAKGTVLSPSKFPKVVAAIKAEVEENFNAFPLPGLTPPPAKWDVKLGKMKPGFTLDVSKLSKEIVSVAGKFKPSGKASAAPEAMPSMSDTSTEAPPPAGPNWLLIGGIAAGVLVVGGLVWAFASSGSSDPKPTPAGA